MAIKEVWQLALPLPHLQFTVFLPALLILHIITLSLSFALVYCLDNLKDHIGIFLFNIDGFEALNTGTILDVDYDIACRTGLHCAPLCHEGIGTADIHGGVRFGIGPFNTEEHIKAAIKAVKEITELRQKK